MSKKVQRNKALSSIFKVFLSIALVLTLSPTVNTPNEANAVNNSSTSKASKITTSIVGREKSQSEIQEQIDSKSGVIELTDRSDVNHRNKIDSGASLQASLPSSVDLRTKGTVTSVKNQNATTTCWAYASNAAAETSIANATGISPQDLSPFQTAFFGYERLSSDTSELKGSAKTQAGEGLYVSSAVLDDEYYKQFGITYENCRFNMFGGTIYQPASEFMQGIGVSKESEISFPSIVSQSGFFDPDSMSLTSSQREISVATLKNWKYLGSAIKTTTSSSTTTYAGTDENVITAIKSQLVSGNAVEISYFGDNNQDPTADIYFNHSTNAQYTYEYKGSNHAVCVVGYDDSYSKSNFLSGHQPDKDGAFIVKNSWGSSWGDSGYFYLSYYDQSLDAASVYEFNTSTYQNGTDINNVEIVDQYDYLQMATYVGGSATVTGGQYWYSSIYTASQNQVLHSIATYVGGSTKKLGYKVYKLKSDATSPKDVAGSLDSPDAQGTVDIDYEGYRTVDLSTPVQLKEGEKYAIWFYQTDNNNGYYFYQTAMLSSTYISIYNFAGNSVINSGETFTSHDPENEWDELSGSTYTDSYGLKYAIDNYCVKGYSTAAKTVKFETNGAGTIDDQLVAINSKVTQPTNITKTGYTAEWYTDSGLTNKYNFDTPVTGDLTLYLKWVLTPYTVTYNGIDGATNNNPSSFNMETETITLNDPVKTGYTFTGWYKGTQKVEQIPKGTTGNLELEAKWEPNTYTINFSGGSGAAGSTNSVDATYDQDATLPACGFSKSGYTFTGWSYDSKTYQPGDSVKNLASDDGASVEFSATWSINTYTLTYKGLEGATNNNPANYTVETDTITLNDPVKTGYTFTGWYKGDEKVEQILKGSTGNVELTAKWKANTYTITFSGGAGATGLTNFISATYDQDATLPVCGFSKLGYSFAGWSYGSKTYNAGAKVKNLTSENGASVQFDAKWSIITYTITYKGLEGATNNNPENYTVETDTITLNNLSRVGYQFKGWYKGDDEVTEITKGSRGNLVLTAKWEPNTYTLNFSGGAGATGSTDSVNATYDQNATIPTCAFERLGYTFTGWTYGSKTYQPGDTVKNLTTDNDANLEFVATWSIDTYTISYSGLEGATNNNPANYTVETNTITLNDPVKTGYTFTGWYKGDEKVEQISKGSTGNIELTAKWEVNTYTLNFTGGDGATGSVDSINATYDQDITLPTCGFEKPGYTFTGWSYGSKTYKEGEVVKNLTDLNDANLEFVATWTSFVNVYRLYNPYNGEHFMTTDENEYNVLRQQAWWRDEGLAWRSPGVSNTRVYRFYGYGVNGEHFFTIDENEARVLMTRTSEYRYEGTGWYTADTVTDRPVYRLANVYTWQHLFTTDANEMRVLSTQYADTWIIEGVGGVAWYCY